MIREPVESVIKDFPVHLQPYAQAFVDAKLKESTYSIAKEQILLHETFDVFMASGVLDGCMRHFVSEAKFLEYLFTNELVRSQFQQLEHSLIKLSFERRVQIVSLQDEILTYADWFSLLGDEQLRLHVESLISKLKAEGFFDVDSSGIDWGKKSFSELIDEFGHVFCSSLPKHYVIQGLIDCRTFLGHQDIDRQETFIKEFEEFYIGLSEHLHKVQKLLFQFWKDTRYYEHEYYAIIRDPLKQVIFGVLTQGQTRSF